MLSFKKCGFVADYIKLPTNWSQMGSTEFSKTEELRPDSQEYKKVEKMFNCTAGGTVKEIKKVSAVTYAIC